MQIQQRSDAIDMSTLKHSIVGCHQQRIGTIGRCHISTRGWLDIDDHRIVTGLAMNRGDTADGVDGHRIITLISGCIAITGIKLRGTDMGAIDE